MASGCHLITSFQGWAKLRNVYCPWSLSASGSELPQTQIRPSHALDSTLPLPGDFKSRMDSEGN